MARQWWRWSAYIVHLAPIANWCQWGIQQFWWGQTGPDYLIVSLPFIHVTSWALRYVSDMCRLFGGKKTRVEKMSQITDCSQERCNSLEPCFLLQRQISAEPQRVSGHGRGQDCLSSGNLITCLWAGNGYQSSLHEISSYMKLKWFRSFASMKSYLEPVCYQKIQSEDLIKGYQDMW